MKNAAGNKFRGGREVTRLSHALSNKTLLFGNSIGSDRSTHLSDLGESQQSRRR